MKPLNLPIDIILPWVEGSDSAWIEQKAYYQQRTQFVEGANTHVRYQNWDNLQYWFRAVEKCMPWINRIFFVTWGHLPEFLDTQNPRLKVIRHDEYIPEKYLPTFNSNTIEMNYHRIEELSENFILFNDDTFPLKPLPETYYFKKNKVCEEAVETPIMPVYDGSVSNYFCFVRTNNMIIINRHFNKREVQKKDFWKWFYPGYGRILERNIRLHYWYNFVGFHDHHMPVPLKKSTLKRLWEVEPQALDLASCNRFRADTDLSQYLIRYWQLCEGDFYPRKSLGKPYIVTENNYRAVASEVEEGKHPIVCFSEECIPDRFEEIKNEINRALQSRFPDKSTFEK